MTANHSSAATQLQQSVVLPDGCEASVEPILTHKRVVGYFDGCFDVMHSGHYNAFRMARELCDELIVGVHSSSEIERTKKVKPVQTDEERIRLVGSCKWVDRVVISKEYSPDYLKLLDKYGCTFAIHGSDINLNAEGKDPFAEVKKAGRFRTLPRIGTISTTEIITRLLKATSADPHEQKRSEEEEDADSYLLTTDRLCKFINTARHRPHVPKEGHKVVYVAGSFDLFHSGHVRLLQEAKKLGDFLLVGLHEDSSVLAHTGPGMPIMSLFERAMNVLGCRDVDEVVFDAPFIITHDMCAFLGIDIVVRQRGVNIDYGADSSNPYKNFENEKGENISQSGAGSMLKKLLDSSSSSSSGQSKSKAVMIDVQLPAEEVLTSKTLAERVNENREKYMEKVNKE